MNQTLSNAVTAIKTAVGELERQELAGWALILVLVLALPVVANPFYVSVGISVLFGVVIASSWNLLAMTGYINFGHVMFIGLGSFTAGHLTLQTGLGTGVGWGLIAVVLLSGLACLVFALAIAYPLLRLSGHYFALAAFGVAQALLALFHNVDILRGSDGIIMPSLRTGFAIFGPSDVIYYLMTFVAVFTVIVVYFIRNSTFGYRLRAIRFAEDTAGMLGIPTTRYTIITFAISGFLAGMGGAVNAYYLSYFTAPNTFNIVLSIDAIVMSLIGGLGTVLGPIVGTVIFVLLNDLVLDSITTKGRLLFTGAIVIVIVLAAPEGVIELYRQYRAPDSTDVHEEKSDSSD